MGCSYPEREAQKYRGQAGVELKEKNPAHEKEKGFPRSPPGTPFSGDLAGAGCSRHELFEFLPLRLSRNVARFSLSFPHVAPIKGSGGEPDRSCCTAPRLSYPAGTLPCGRIPTPRSRKTPHKERLSLWLAPSCCMSAFFSRGKNVNERACCRATLNLVYFFLLPFYPSRPSDLVCFCTPSFHASQYDHPCRPRAGRASARIMADVWQKRGVDSIALCSQPAGVYRMLRSESLAGCVWCCITPKTMAHLPAARSSAGCCMCALQNRPLHGT